MRSFKFSSKDVGCHEQGQPRWNCNLWSSSRCSCWLPRMFCWHFYHSIHSHLAQRELSRAWKDEPDTRQYQTNARQVCDVSCIICFSKHVTSKVCWYTWPSHFEKGRSIEAGIPKNPSNINPTSSNVFRSMMKYAFGVWRLTSSDPLKKKSYALAILVWRVYLRSCESSMYTSLISLIPHLLVAKLWGGYLRALEAQQLSEAAQPESQLGSSKTSNGFECESTIQFNLFL